MKYNNREYWLGIAEVAPLVGAWIEIDKNDVNLNQTRVAPLVGAWIEITYFIMLPGCISVVAPLVGAWIEI